MYDFNIGIKYCRYCGERIEENRSRCPYCASLLNKPVKMHSTSAVIEAEAKAEVKVNPETGNQSFENPYQINERVFTEQVMVKKKKLSNGLKVFLTILFTIIPFIGSAAGIIAGTMFMGSNDDEDRRTFGSALFVASLILFILSFIIVFIIYLGTMI